MANYLTDILSTPDYKDQAIVFEFLSTQSSERDQKFDLEDALPSTLTRTRALALAADVNGLTTASTMIMGAYYPDWATTAVPPESIDFTKFDLLYFGTSDCFLRVSCTMADDAFNQPSPPRPPRLGSRLGPIALLC